MPIREVNNSLLAIIPMCRCAARKFTVEYVNFYKYSMCLCAKIGLLKRVVNILHLLHKNLFLNMRMKLLDDIIIVICTLKYLM